MARQRILLNTSSGQRSTSSNGKRADKSASWRDVWSAIFLGSGFISSSGTRLVTLVKAVKAGTSVKQSFIGVAVASNSFMGGKPNINSIVRSRLV